MTRRYTPDAERLLDQAAQEAIHARDARDRDGYDAAVAKARHIMDNPRSYEPEVPE